VFTKSANCASITDRGLYLEAGSVIQVGRTSIMAHGIKYPRALEIDIYIRDGVIVDANSQAGLKVLGERGPVEDADLPKGPPTMVRGMPVERGEGDYQERPIVKPSKQAPGRVEGATEAEAQKIAAEMKSVKRIADHVPGEHSNDPKVRRVAAGKKPGQFSKADHTPLSESKGTPPQLQGADPAPQDASD